MKIGLIAPLYEAVPPRLYGGTERVVYFLAEELVKQGHDVTLFASGDSNTSARLVPIVPEALRLYAHCEDTLALHIVELMTVLDLADEFDILHFHVDYLHFPFTQKIKTPHVTTLHGKLSIAELQLIYDLFPDQPVISISFSQRKPLPQANWTGNVYHGIPCGLFSEGKGNGEYLAFLGRISPEKGLETAINISKRTGIPLKIAAKIDKVDDRYFNENIKPLLDHKGIEFIGEINDRQKNEFLGNAKALLFTINWDEPFGMVMIEANACGTPVVAFGLGSVPEIITDGMNGFIVQDEEEAINAINRIDSLNRSRVRKTFEQRFSSERMANDYVEIYKQLIQYQIKTGQVIEFSGRKLPAI